MKFPASKTGLNFHLPCSLRKHVYSNILKLLPPIKQELSYDSIARLFAPCLPMISHSRQKMYLYHHSIPNIISYVS